MLRRLGVGVRSKIEDFIAEEIEGVRGLGRGAGAVRVREVEVYIQVPAHADAVGQGRPGFEEGVWVVEPGV